MKELAIISNDTVAATSKTAYLFSPEAFDELYNIVMQEDVKVAAILAEFEKNKMVETQ